MMGEKLYFTSSLNVNKKDELDDLLFFNEKQSGVVEKILRSIEEYGLPRTIVENNKIRVIVGENRYVQNLFLIREKDGKDDLIGAVIYIRDSDTNATVLHISIKPDQTMNSGKSKQIIALKMIEELKLNLSKIKGVKTLTIFYEIDRSGIIRIKK
jgi:hypothetical protein